MFWKRDINLRTGLLSRYHIDSVITDADGFQWRFTEIYGEPKLEDRVATWRLLRNIKHHSDLPWLCAGDFNEILLSCEKEGGAARPQVYMDRLKEALEDAKLHDLGFSGDPFTWRNNSKTSENYIKERLDRAVASQEWCAHFPNYRVINGDPRHSDHRPIIIQMEKESEGLRRSPMERPFRFEAKWLEEDNCEEIVMNAWKHADRHGIGSVMGNIKEVAGELIDWSKTSLGNLENRISRTKKDLEVCRRKEISHDQVQREHLLCYKH
jgi:hypothetical protein